MVLKIGITSTCLLETFYDFADKQLHTFYNFRKKNTDQSVISTVRILTNHFCSSSYHISVVEDSTAVRVESYSEALVHTCPKIIGTVFGREVIMGGAVTSTFADAFADQPSTSRRAVQV